MTTLAFSPLIRTLDANGNPLSGAKLYFYVTGTSTPQDVYTTEDLDVPHANPVVADSGGRYPNIYPDPELKYRMYETTAAGVPTGVDVDPLDSAVDEFLQTGDGAVIRSRLDKLRERVSPDDFDAVPDNATDAAAAVATAMAAHSHIEPNAEQSDGSAGTYLLVPDDLQPTQFRNQTTSDRLMPLPWYGAVKIDQDNLTFSGPGVFRTKMRPPATTGSEIHFGFVTEQNMTVGDVKDLTFSNIGFDMANADVGTANTNQRAIHFIGVERLVFDHVWQFSSQARRGGGIYADNCHNVLNVGYRAFNNSTGYNVKYTDDAVTVGFTIHDVNEAFDYDGTSRGIAHGFGTFTGTSDTGDTKYKKQQPIDINGTRDGVFGFMTFYKYGGNTISYKNTTPPDYATFKEWPNYQLDTDYEVGDTVQATFYNSGDLGKPVGANFYIATQAGRTDVAGLGPQTKTTGIVDGTVIWDYVANPYTLTPPQRLAMVAMSHTECGNTGSTILTIGNEWSVSNNLRHDPGDPAKDIVVFAHQSAASTSINVLEGRRLKLIANSQEDVKVPANTGPYALDCMSSVAMDEAYQYSDLTITVAFHSIDTAEKGGISFARARKALLTGSSVTNINTTATASTYAVSFTNLETRAATVRFSDNDIDGDVLISGNTAAVVAWAAGAAITKGMIRKNGSDFYQATVGGTTAGAGGPTGTGQAIVDNTVTWKWVPPFKFLWDSTNNITGSIVFASDGQKYVHGVSAPAIVGNLGALVASDRTIIGVDRRAVVARACLWVNANVTGNATDYRTVEIRRWRAGSSAVIGSVTTVAGWTAHTKVVIPIALNEANAVLQYDDHVDFNVPVPGVGTGGAGQALNGLTVQIEILYC